MSEKDFMEATTAAMVWIITFCAQPMFVHADGKCDDGTAAHKLEMRLLDGRVSSDSAFNIDNIKVDRLFVLLRDDQEIATLPASLVSAEEAYWLLQLAWPRPTP